MNVEKKTAENNAVNTCRLQNSIKGISKITAGVLLIDLLIEERMILHYNSENKDRMRAEIMEKWQYCWYNLENKAQ